MSYFLNLIPYKGHTLYIKTVQNWDLNILLITKELIRINMSEPKYYSAAPIIEAVLALQVLPSENFNKSFYEEIRQNVSDKFKVEDFNEITFEFSLDEEAVNNVNNRKQSGIVLTSLDKKYIIHMREYSYSFSALNYYTKWEDFISTAYNYWELYINIFNPQKVVREGIRYINRIDIPETKIDLKDYFKLYPQLFDDPNIGLAGFFMQAQLEQNEGGVANIIQAVTKPEKPGFTSIILDIDVFDNKRYEIGSQELIDRINLLRDQKNRIFGASITNKTEELIK